MPALESQSYVFGDTQTYVFGDTQIEQQRLVAQAESFEMPACWLLDQIGIQPGWRVIDVGCVLWAPSICCQNASDQMGSLSDSSERRALRTWHKTRFSGVTGAMSRCFKQMPWQAACRSVRSTLPTNGWSWVIFRPPRFVTCRSRLNVSSPDLGGARISREYRYWRALPHPIKTIGWLRRRFTWR
jgi:hypothetical protein